MRLVADTNTFLAVALDEPEKPWIIQATDSHTLVAPSVLPFEVGNAITALVKRKALRANEAADVWDAVAGIPVELMELDIRAAVLLAVQHNLYAYDGYFLQCAVESRSPLLTLDQGMRTAAKQLGISVVEQT